MWQRLELIWWHSERHVATEDWKECWHMWCMRQSLAAALALASHVLVSAWGVNLTRHIVVGRVRHVYSTPKDARVRGRHCLCVKECG